MRVSQLEPAIRLLARAMDLCEVERRTPSELCLWCNALGDAVSRTRAAPDLLAIGTRVLRRVDAAGTLSERIAARVDVARAVGGVNLFDEAYKRLDEAIALAGGDAANLSEALIVEIEMASRSGEFARGLRATEKLEGLGPVRSSRALNWISFVRSISGDTAAALRALDEAARLDRPDDLTAAAQREKNRVLCHLNARDYRAAAEASARAIDLARAAGTRYDLAATLHNLGDACRKLGELPRAYAALAESKEVCEAAGLERLATLNQMYLAYLDGVSGLPDAERLLRELIRYAESRGYLTDARQGRYQLGAVLAFRGQVDEARRELGELLRESQAQGDQTSVDETQELLAKL